MKTLRDASENPMRIISVERLVLNVFVGEGDDRLVTHLPAHAEAKSVFSTTFALIQTVRKIAERSSPKLVQGENSCSCRVEQKAPMSVSWRRP